MDVSGIQACPSCGEEIAAGEVFCTGCGTPTNEPAPAPDVVQDPPPPVPVGPYITEPPVNKVLSTDRIGKARKWLFAVAILTLLTGLFYYFTQKEAVEKQITAAEQQTAQMDPGERDQQMQQNIGMTFAEAVAHDRGRVNLMLAINIAMAAIYLGLWWWAKRNPLPAALIALLLFITVTVINAVMEPTSMYQGVIVKVFFVVALARAIGAAKEERKLVPT